MIQLLEAFLAHDYTIIFASTASKTQFSYDLKGMDIEEVPIQLNDSSFDDFVKELKLDAVLFDRFMVEEQFGWRVAENCPEVVRILNTEDLHSLREYRRTCFTNNLRFLQSEYLREDKTKREFASIFRSDLTLLVSSFERGLLENSIGIPSDLLLHLPFMLPEITHDEMIYWPSFDDRSDFISYGNGHHAPNIDSFQQLKHAIWPLIRKALPNARLHIYGAYLPQSIKQLHAPKNGFLVHGWAQNLNELVRRAKVVLAPLNFGAGIKGKLTTAMQCGTPNITTEIGKEGMAEPLPWSGAIGTNAEELANSAIQLYQDREKWEQLQKNGITIINSVFNTVVLQEKLLKRMEHIINNLDTYRSKNIVGSLLHHQTMASTKYMGKWIEEKNKSRK